MDADLHSPMRASSAEGADVCADAAMARLRRNDPDALDELIQLHWSEVIRYALSFVECRDIAEDLSQTAFVGLWEQRNDWQERGSTLAFLLRVVRNQALNRRRHLKVRAQAERHVVSAPVSRRPVRPDERLAEREAARVLENAIRQLPERRREVFRLARFQNLSYRQISEVMEISPQTVANQMSQALSELREALETRNPSSETLSSPPGGLFPPGSLDEGFRLVR
jgi:RNA polymerase sigma-70 factor (family 1)